MSFIEFSDVFPSVHRDSLLAADREGRVNLRSLKDGETRCTPPGHFGGVTCLALGSLQALIGTADAAILVHTKTFGEDARKVALASTAECCCAGVESPQLSEANHAGLSDVFALGQGDGQLMIITTTQSGLLLWGSVEAHPGVKVTRVWLDRATQTVCSLGSDSGFKCWHYEEQGDDIVLTLQSNLTGHTGSVTCASFVEGLPLFVSGGVDQTIRVWDTIQGKCVTQLTRPNGACAHHHSVTDVAVVSFIQMDSGLRATIVSCDSLGYSAAWVLDIPASQECLSSNSSSESENERSYKALLRQIMGSSVGSGKVLDGFADPQITLAGESQWKAGFTNSKDVYVLCSRSAVWGPSLCCIRLMSDGQYFATILPISPLLGQAEWWEAKLSVCADHTNWTASRVLVAAFAHSKEIMSHQSHQNEVVWAHWGKSFVYSVCRSGLLLVRETRTGNLHRAIGLSKQILAVSSSEMSDGRWVEICHADGTFTLVSPSLDVSNYSLPGAGGCVWTKRLLSHVVALQENGYLSCINIESGLMAGVQLAGHERIRCAMVLPGASDFSMSVLCTGASLSSTVWKLSIDDVGQTIVVAPLAQVVSQDDASGTSTGVVAEDMQRMLRSSSTGTALSVQIEQETLHVYIGTWGGEVLHASFPVAKLRGRRLSSVRSTFVSGGKQSAHRIDANSAKKIQASWMENLGGAAILCTTTCSNMLCVSDGDSVQCLLGSQWLPCELHSTAASTVTFIGYLRDGILLCGWSCGKLTLVHVPQELVSEAVSAGAAAAESQRNRLPTVAAQRTPPSTSQLDSTRFSSRRPSTRSVLAASMRTELDEHVQKSRSMRVSVAHMSTSRNSSLSKPTKGNQQIPTSTFTPHAASIKPEVFQIRNPLAAQSKSPPARAAPPQQAKTGPSRALKLTLPLAAAQQAANQAPPLPTGSARTVLRPISTTKTEEHTWSLQGAPVQGAGGSTRAQERMRKPCISPSSAVHLHAPRRQADTRSNASPSIQPEDQAILPGLETAATNLIPVPSEPSASPTTKSVLDAGESPVAREVPQESGDSRPKRKPSRTFSRRKSVAMQAVSEESATGVRVKQADEQFAPVSGSAVETQLVPEARACTTSAELQTHSPIGMHRVQSDFDDLMQQAQAARPEQPSKQGCDGQSMVRRAAKPVQARKK